MSEPCISSEAYDAAVLAVAVASLFFALGVGALVLAAQICSNARLGRKLLKACGGDYGTATTTVEIINADREANARSPS